MELTHASLSEAMRHHPNQSLVKIYPRHLVKKEKEKGIYRHSDWNSKLNDLVKHNDRLNGNAASYSTDA